MTFISPQEGGQALGPLPIEVTTSVTGVDRVEFYVDGALVGVARRAPFRIAHDFGSSLAGHEIVARVYSNGYPTTDTARIVTAAITAGETLNVDLVEVPLRIRSERSITGNDLRVRENNVDQTIREVRADRGPARFVFVVDRSLSMGGGKLEAALRGGTLHDLVPSGLQDAAHQFARCGVIINQQDQRHLAVTPVAEGRLNSVGTWPMT